MFKQNIRSIGLLFFKYVVFVIASKNQKDRTRRIRCGNSSICLNEKQLCNGIQDCPFNYFEDEKLLCLWQNRSLVTHNSNTYFTCHNSLQIGFNQVCNGILNCANGEDEVFCRIADPPWNAAYSDRFLLDIDIYPQQL
ncbi:unnamed protein product [Rotaria socialis]|uniref:Uncharacterized protein n=1 Tax=Rotaria socialis TaxID=392032 RepID=A0A821Q136_9BILA|nr:unnamed protein product [Rotaria socialis]CAF4816588.1 unnamed protein product [Rotaria socialis]